VILQPCARDLSVFRFALYADDRVPSCKRRADAFRSAASKWDENASFSDRREDDSREILG
jgi:hypothetical protein